MSTPHLILEWSYFAAGVALAIIAAIGLRQLTIAKNAARMNAKRESFRLAAEQCAFYLNVVIPLINELNQAIKRDGIVFVEKSSVEIKGDEVKVKSTASNAQRRDVLKVIAPLLDAYNALEAFSLYFTSGVADEKVAFTSVGTTFCNTVRDFLPDLVITNADEEKYFQNILRLFFLWNARFESKKLKTEKARIEAELDSVKDKFIRPIGT